MPFVWPLFSQHITCIFLAFIGKTTWLKRLDNYPFNLINYWVKVHSLRLHMHLPLSNHLILIFFFSPKFGILIKSLQNHELIIQVVSLHMRVRLGIWLPWVHECVKLKKLSLYKNTTITELNFFYTIKWDIIFLKKYMQLNWFILYWDFYRIERDCYYCQSPNFVSTFK